MSGEMGGQHERDELLSVYADGEATPAERSAAEALLASSPDARRVLDEMRTVSRLLHALPSPPAPPAILTTVQTRIGSPVTPAAAAPKRRFRGYRREWLAGLSAIAMTLLIGGLISLQLPNDAATESSVAGLTVKAPAPALPWDEATPASEFRITESSAAREGIRRDAMLGTNAESKTAERSLDRTLRMGSAPTLAATPAAPVADLMTQSLVETETLDGLRTSSVDDVERLREVLPYLRLQDENGAAIGNVELVVVDAQRVANQFQVLLMQNGVTTLDARTVDFDADATTADAARKPGAVGKPTTDSMDLFAVYTEAPGEPLSKTLEQLIKQREVLGMRLQPPLQVAADDKVAQADKLAEKGVGVNLKQLAEAYVTQKLDDNASSWNDDVVSAADAIAEARGEPADNLQRHFSVERQQIARGRTSNQRLANSTEPTPPESTPAPRRGVRPAIDPYGNVASFNTLVKLPVSAPADESPSRSTYSFADNQSLARNNIINSPTQSGAAPDARPEDLAQMRSRFARTAPNTYRILWVLQPLSPTTSNTTLPATPGSPGR